MTVSYLPFALCIFFLAGFTQGIVGFGFSIISVSMLTLLTASTADIVGLNLIPAALNGAVLFYLVRRDVAYRRVLIFILVCGLFTIPGILFLRFLDRATVMLTLGAAVLGITFFSMVRTSRKSGFFSRPSFGYGAAMVSGFLAGAFTVPGPPMIAYFYNTEPSAKQAKANIQFYFVGLNLIIVPLFICNGLLDGKTFISGLCALPLVVVSTWIGHRVALRLPVPVFSRIVNIFLIVLGLSILIRASFSLWSGQ